MLKGFRFTENNVLAELYLMIKQFAMLLFLCSCKLAEREMSPGKKQEWGKFAAFPIRPGGGCVTPPPPDALIYSALFLALTTCSEVDWLSLFMY